MRVRKILNGDYCLGHGAKEILSNTPDAVAQNVMTRLALWQNTWFLDDDEGTPWAQEILEKHEYADAVIRSRILETDGVTEISDFQTIVDPDTRTLTVTATIETEYGSTQISEALNGN